MTPSNPPVPSKAREKQVAHTPGPWTVADYTTINSGDRPVLCGRKEWPVVVSAVLPSMTERCGKRLKDERDANARLIAAAPDLLDACQAFEDIERPGEMSEADDFDRLPVWAKLYIAELENAGRDCLATVEEALATLGAKTP